jgi:hypothetical protein
VVANGSLTPADVAGKDRHAGGHPDASPQAVPRLREARSVSTYDLCGVHCPPHRYGDAAKRKHYVTKREVSTVRSRKADSSTEGINNQ